MADRGYFKGEDPRVRTSGHHCIGAEASDFEQPGPRGSSTKDFRYIPTDDEYECPAGQRAIWRLTTVENGQTLHKHWSSACPRCSIKAQCTTGEYRRIARWDYRAMGGSSVI